METNSISHSTECVTHHEIVGLDSEQVPKVPKCYRCVDLKSKFTKVMGRRYARSFGWKRDRFDLPEVHHQKIALRFGCQASDLKDETVR